MIINGNYISDYNSYSLLKKYDDDGPKGLINREPKSNKSLRRGTLMDDYLYLDKDEFYKRYIVTSINLAPMLQNLALEVRKTFKIENIDSIKDDPVLKQKVIAVIKKMGLFKNVKNDDTFIKKFDIPEFYNYCKELYDGRNLVHVRDLIRVKEASNVLYTNEKTKEYFLNDHENIYQLEVKYDYLGRKMKCFLDMVIIDHENKKIKGIDLKTGSPGPEEFMTNFFKFKYYLQAAIYYLALKHYNNEHFDGEYEVENFRFLFQSNNDIENPLIYTVSDKWIKCAINGFTTTSGFKYRGVNDLVEEVNWHREKGVFNLSREAYESKEIILRDNFITEV